MVPKTAGYLLNPTTEHLLIRLKTMKKHLTLPTRFALNVCTAILWLAIPVLTSCKKNTPQESLLQNTTANTIKSNNTIVKNNNDSSVSHTTMSYFHFEQVTDLTVFFDSIASKNHIPGSSDNAESATYIHDFKQCIKDIDEYRQGKRKFYPDKHVSQCLNSLGFYAAQIEDHATSIDLTYSEWFMMCAAYYAPDITCLVHMQSADHHIGVRNFGQEYNYNPWWCYVFIAREKGYEVQCLKDFSKTRSLFTLQKQGKTYYLLSNNFNPLEFTQYLYGEDKTGRISKLAECLEAPNNCEQEFNTYYFNKNNYEWYYCLWDDKLNQRERVTNQPALQLILNGEKSKFECH